RQSAALGGAGQQPAAVCVVDAAGDDVGGSWLLLPRSRGEVGRGGRGGIRHHDACGPPPQPSPAARGREPFSCAAPGSSPRIRGRRLGGGCLAESDITAPVRAPTPTLPPRAGEGAFVPRGSWARPPHSPVEVGGGGVRGW